MEARPIIAPRRQVCEIYELFKEFKESDVDEILGRGAGVRPKVLPTADRLRSFPRNSDVTRRRMPSGRSRGRKTTGV